MAEVCDPCLIGLDVLTAGGCKIDLGRGVMQLVGKELPLGGMSTDERVELEAPNSVLILPGAEAVILARWRAHTTWQGSCGLAELLPGQSTLGLVVGRTLVNTDGPIVSVRVINCKHGTTHYWTGHEGGRLHPSGTSRRAEGR